MRTDGIKLVISGDGKGLTAELGRQEKGLKSFAGKAGTMLKGVGSKMRSGLGSMAGKLSPLAMIGGTAGVMMAAKNLMDYQDSLSSLGIRARLSAEDMMKLDKRVHDLAYSTGQSREGLVGAIKDMTDTVGYDYAAEAIEHVGKAATAMSIDVKDAAGAYTIFRRDMGATAEEASALFNTMAAMDGDFALGKLATSVSTLGLNKDNFGQYNALIQSIKGQMGGADAAARAIDSIALRIRSGRRVRRELARRGGGDLFDTEGNIKDFRKFMEFMSAQPADLRKRMFEQRDSRAFLGFDTEKGFEVFDAFVKSGREATFVSDAFARKQKEVKFQINALTAAGKEFAGAALSPILADITAKLTELTNNPDRMNKFRSDIMSVADALGAVAKTVMFVAKGLGLWGQFWEDMGTMYGSSGPVTVGKVDVGTKEEREIKHGLRDETGKKVKLDGATKKQRKEEMNNELHKRIQEAIADDIYKKTGKYPTISGQPIKVDNPVSLTVNITETGRVIAESDNPSSRPNVKVNRGAF